MKTSDCPCFFSSTIGRKVIMAVTGLCLMLFVVAHLLGNLQIFQGQEVFNNYAAFLKSLGNVLNLARIGLLAIFVAHISTAISLWKQNSNARQTQYKVNYTVQASAASLYMIHTGLAVLMFVIIHLLHFTFGWLQPEYFHLTDKAGRHDVYSMLVFGFMNPVYTAIYCIAMFLLGLHLTHAFWSIWQTLGFNHPRYTPLLKKVGVAFGTIIAFAYVSIPLAVAVGIVRLPGK